MSIPILIKKITANTLLITSLSVLSISTTAQDSQDFDLELADETQEMQTASDIEDFISSPDSIQSCSEIASKIETANKTYTENTEIFISRYENINKKLSILQVSLEEYGEDTTELKDYMRSFELVTDRFEVLVTRLLNSLDTAQEIVCSEPEEVFLSQRTDFQNRIIRVNQKSNDVKNIMSENLLPIISSFK